MSLTEEQKRIAEEHIERAEIAYEKRRNTMAEMNKGFKEIAIKVFISLVIFGAVINAVVDLYFILRGIF